MTRRLMQDLSLDQIDDFFKIGKTVEVSTVPRSRLNGRLLDPTTGGPAVATVQPYIPPYKRHARVNNPMQTAYAEDYRIEEDRSLTENQSVCGISCGRSESSSVTGQMSRIDLDSTITGMSQVTLPEGMTEENALSVYQNYDFKRQYDEKLPIAKHRAEILRTVENYPVTVIQGETGCGKTTQVAQYILDYCASQGRYCNIIVTQPRKIAAINICKRVCAERNWREGDVCGYQVGMDRVAGEDTRLLYCTTGILLKRLIAQKHMREFTHVILDEVHERDQNSDFCLLVVRKLLCTNSSGVKVVMMSATIDSRLFANYFSVPVGDQLSPSPVLTIQGRTYKVSEFYLDDLRELSMDIADMRYHHPTIAMDLYKLAVRLIDTFDKIEAAQFGKYDKGISKARGSVLIFLPGIHEINELDDLLSQSVDERKYVLVPLHSTLTGPEQAKVFHKPAAGYRKIILSTNIAESSITVADIKYVIDFCLTKNLECDQETNYSILKLQWASKANCKQRMGRAGRVANGRVYRMVYQQFYEEQLPDYTTPEMQRCPLDNLVLQVKLLDLGEPKAMLGLALSPPNLDDLERTILVLKEVGALSTLREGSVNVHDGELTFVGRVLASLPVDVRLGKLMLLGYVFGCLKECIIIAAGLSLRSFFAHPFKANFKAYRHKLAWAGNPPSDCIALLNAYKVWEDKKSKDWFRGSLSRELEWGGSNFLQVRRIHEVHQLIDELTKRLHRHNIVVPRTPANRTHNGPPTMTAGEESLILQLVICGAFYPNYFIPSEIDEDEAIRTLSGKNPQTTVWVRGLPLNYGILYKEQLETLFWKCDPAGKKPKAHFEQTRAYIEFHRDKSLSIHQSRLVLPAVYGALKLRLLRNDLELYIVDNPLPTEEPAAHAQNMSAPAKPHDNALSSPWVEAERGDENIYEPRPVKMPPPDRTVVAVYVTEVVSPDSFWVHFADADTWNNLRLHQELIQNALHNCSMLPQERVLVGTYCLAPYRDDEDGNVQYYRARIHSIEDTAHSRSVKVFFLDYGNVDKCELRDLKVIPQRLFELPFQAVCCALAQIKPSPLKCPTGQWTPEAVHKFTSLIIQKNTLMAKIYSIVDECLRVELYEQADSRQININAVFKDLRYAQAAEEGRLSKLNHQRREEDALMSHAGAPVSTASRRKTQSLQQAAASHHHQPLLGVKTRNNRVIVQGPWSPLEVTCQSMANVGRTKQSRIENESVNCVCLDEEPHCKCARLLVAAHVSLSQSGNDMQLRQTQIMPKIPGLPALVAMLFCPKAELRTDRAQSRYTGVLCGLGYDEENGGPALPDHDMEIEFDTKFDQKDLCMINQVRLAINVALDTQSQMAEVPEPQLLNIQRRSCSTLLELVKRERGPVESEAFMYPGQWNKVRAEDLLHSNVVGVPEVLYHLHYGIALDLDEEDSSDEEDDGDEEYSEREEEEAAAWRSQMQRADSSRQWNGPVRYSDKRRGNAAQRNEQEGQRGQYNGPAQHRGVTGYGEPQQRASQYRGPQQQQQQQRKPGQYKKTAAAGAGERGPAEYGEPPQQQRQRLEQYTVPQQMALQRPNSLKSVADMFYRKKEREEEQQVAQEDTSVYAPIRVMGAAAGRPLGQSTVTPQPQAAQTTHQLSPEQKALSKRHIQELHALANKSTELRRITCGLCKSVANSPKELLLHLQTRLHKLREEIVNS